MRRTYINTKESLKKMLVRYNNFAFNNSYIIFIVVAITIGISAFYASKLPVKTDFFELLPENYRSIGDLNRVIDSVGGVGNLI
ncbi:MAG: hypothetical protein WCQ47_02110, partial [bacterium]